MADRGINRMGLSGATRAVLDSQDRLADRTQTGEDILEDAGVRLAANTADLDVETAALAPGRYLVKGWYNNATDVAYVRQTAAAAPVACTNTGYPLAHGESMYLRVTDTDNDSVAVLFASAGDFVVIIRSDERGED